MNEKVSDLLRLKKTSDGYYLQRYDGLGSNWGIRLSEDELEELTKVFKKLSKVKKNGTRQTA